MMIREPETAELCLHVPSLQELDYRAKFMADPKTMSYNRGYDLDFSGYDPDTGCLAFPEEEWKEWYEDWIDQEPERFYAYVMRKADRVFIGEVCLHHHGSDDFHEMGIVIEAAYRGKGYGKQALRLLLQYAFETMHVKAVHNTFETDREGGAMALHISCGFRMTNEENGIAELICTPEDLCSQSGSAS